MCTPCFRRGREAFPKPKKGWKKKEIKNVGKPAVGGMKDSQEDEKEDLGLEFLKADSGKVEARAGDLMQSGISSQSAGSAHPSFGTCIVCCTVAINSCLVHGSSAHMVCKVLQK